MTELPKYDPQIHHRRSIRLQGYDYSQAGAYFITLCTHQRENRFGEIINGEMIINEYGQIVVNEWEKSALIRAEIELDAYVIMPNHFHAIVFIVGDTDIHRTGGRTDSTGERPLAPTSDRPDERTGDRPDERTGDRPDERTGDRPVAPTIVPTGPAPKSIGALMAGFKAAVTKRINETRGTPGAPVWQRNYYEHIIRDEKSYLKIASYILNNPAQWELDTLHPGGKA